MTAPPQRRRRLRRLLPRHLRDYDRRALRGDVTAAITVAVLLIPQGMAYALLAGIPPVHGLYASLVPLAVYALLGQSRQLAAGIVALDMLIVGAAIAHIGPPTPAAAAGLAITLSLMAGALQLTVGLLRFGFITDFISRPVIVGFTTAAPLLIGLGQLGNLTGMHIPAAPDLISIGRGLFHHVTEIHPLSTALGLSAAAWVWAGRRYRPQWPHGLAVVVIGTLLAWLLDLQARGVALIGPITAGLPTPALPPLDIDTARALFPSAVTLALIQLVTVISMGRLLASRNRQMVRPNRELVALGASNLLGGLFQSPPVSASFSRTAVNVAAGAVTPLQNGFAALIVLTAILTLDDALAWIPLPVLAAIILVGALSLIDPRETRSIFDLHRAEGIIAVLTMAVTLLIGIEEGVLLGIGASLALMLYRMSRPRIAVLERHPDTGRIVDRAHHEGTQAIPGLLVLRVDGALHFANAEHMRRAVLAHVDHAPQKPHRVLLDGRGINTIDVTAAGVLRDLLDDLDHRDIELALTGFKASPRRVIDQSRLDKRVAHPAIELSAAEVVELLDADRDDA